MHFRKIARYLSSDSTKENTISSAKNIVNSILHGENSFVGDLNNTYSKLLSKGVAIHELSIHNVKPEKMDSYKKLMFDITDIAKKSIQYCQVILNCRKSFLEVGPLKLEL
jgi:hypothetical protein